MKSTKNRDVVKLVLKGESTLKAIIQRRRFLSSRIEQSWTTHISAGSAVSLMTTQRGM